MTREQVKALHRAVDTALASVAQAQGFVYRPGSMSFGDAEVSGRIKFVLAGKTALVDQRYAVGGLKVGDEVSMTGDPKGEQYTITGFTPRGGAKIVRDGDGKAFRCPQYRLDNGKKKAGPMDIRQMEDIVRRTCPGLNRHAASQMVMDFKSDEMWGKPKIALPVNEAEVIIRAKAALAKADVEAQKTAKSGSFKMSGIQMLNESADEMAAEARMS